LSSFLLQLAQEYSECPSGKKGGDLGWFPRGKMAGPFQEVAFNTPVGATSAPFKSTYDFHIPDFCPLHQRSPVMRLAENILFFFL
jgi:hypothetical protein